VRKSARFKSRRTVDAAGKVFSSYKSKDIFTNLLFFTPFTAAFCFDEKRLK
jgi:hypothetical protein